MNDPDFPPFEGFDAPDDGVSNGIPTGDVIRRDGSIADRLRQLADMKAAHQRANAEYKRLKDEYNVFEAEIYNELTEMGIDTVKVDGANFTRRTTHKGVVADAEAFRAWCEQNDVTDVYFEEKPVARNLNELVTTCWDEGKEFPPGINSYALEAISSPNRKDS